MFTLKAAIFETHGELLIFLFVVSLLHLLFRRRLLFPIIIIIIIIIIYLLLLLFRSPELIHNRRKIIPFVFDYRKFLLKHIQRLVG
jgi:hypothetical protein